MICQAKKNGEVKRRGRPTIEGYNNGKPIYFCYGYKDTQTEEMISTCRNCKDCVIFADEAIKEIVEIKCAAT